MLRKALWMFPAVFVIAAAFIFALRASDHDDGASDLKSKSLNLTDLYVFREIDQNPAAAAGDLIFIMNSNDRSVARQQYYFSTNARYEFHVSRRAARTDPITAADDVILRFEFGAPNAQKQQAVTVTAILDGQTLTAAQPVLTTPLGQPDPAPDANAITLGASALTVFAGLREDPFFFDVEQFFRVRAGALTPPQGPAAAFRPAATAVDFTSGYNVNSIVVRVPTSFLAGTTGATTFDVWETISILR